MKHFLLAAFIFPLIANCQKIKKSEVDKFTKMKRIETSQEFLRNGILETVGVSYRAADTACFINLNAVNWAVGVIGSGDKLLFLLDSDETISATSPEIQSTTYSRQGSYYSHQYRINKQDVEKLASHNLKSIRRYTSTGYIDLDIKEKKQEGLKELSTVFLEELNK